MAITEKLLVEKADGIGTLTLNQPSKRNAISFEMWRDFPEAMVDLENDVRFVARRARGRDEERCGVKAHRYGPIWAAAKLIIPPLARVLWSARLLSRKPTTNPRLPPLFSVRTLYGMTGTRQLTRG